MTDPSAMTWSPACRWMISPYTTCSTGISEMTPFLRTDALPVVMTFRLRIICRTLSSWTIPMEVLQMTIPRNSISLYDPVRKIRNPRNTFSKLNQVKVWARMISPVERIPALSVILVRPRAVRSSTSLSVRPVSGSAGGSFSIAASSSADVFRLSLPWKTRFSGAKYFRNFVPAFSFIELRRCKSGLRMSASSYCVTIQHNEGRGAS